MTNTVRDAAKDWIGLGRKVNMSFYRTGYEFSRVSLKKIDKKTVQEAKEIGELYCDICGTTQSKVWYEEKIINNYLPDYRFICENCK
jgi:hypothetical protein